jgi:polysaccharide export outer membrane protein
MQVKKSVSLALLAGLAGCASLPNSGPSGGQILKSARAPDAALPVQLVEITNAASLPSPAFAPTSAVLQNELEPPPTDMIGPGDILDITIYEVGVTLFGGSAGAGGDAKTAAMAPASSGAQAQKLPPSRVDDSGDILIPYAGKLHVVGHTVDEVDTMIRHSLRRLSQDPQVIVTRAEVISNSVIVGGEVVRPGRLVLQTNRETLSDVISLAGGYRGKAMDLSLRLVRRNQSVDVRLNDLIEKRDLDVRAYPGDRLTLINDPLTFSVLGAPGRVEQLPFTRSTISLVEAVATAGGANPAFGNPAAIFVFRYVTDAEGKETPVVYHINMMKTGAYFVAQRFAMRDKDVLYFGNAAANQPSKLLQLISQLFTPLATVVAGAQTLQNSN